MPESSLHVLIVEDNPADARMLLRELRQAGFAPCFTRVETEIEFLAHLAPCPDIVICDYNLPQFDALRALELLRQREPDVPFVIVSGSIGEETAVRAIKMGATDYLLKSHLGRLGSVVTHALDQRRLREVERQAQRRIAHDAMLLANVRDSVVVTDLEGIVTFWNEGATQLFGWPAEEMLGRPYADRLPECVRSDIAVRMRGVPDGNEWSGEFEDYRKDGSRFWIYSRVVRLVDAADLPTGILELSYDITEHKRATVVEKELQRFLQSTLDALASHIAVLDGEGNILAVNRAWQRFSEANGGIPASCGVGANYFDVCQIASEAGAEEALAVRQGIHEVMAGDTPEFSLEYPCHSSVEQRWFIIRVTRFESEGPVRTIVSHENITKRKLAELEREAARDQLRHAMGQANCLLWQADVQETFPNGLQNMRFDSERGTELTWELQIINQTADDMPSFLPLDREQGETVAKALHYSRLPEDEIAAGITAREALWTGQPRYTQTFRNRMMDGSIRYLFEDVRIAEVLPGADTVKRGRDGLPLHCWQLTGVVTDITERTQAEEALRISEERFRTTLENLIEGCQIISWEWRYIYINAAAVQHGRKPAHELLGRTMQETFPGIENSEMFATLERCMTQHVPAHIENEFFYTDGTSAWFQLVIQPVPEGLFILSEDITKRKHAEQALRQAHEELEARVIQRTRDLMTATEEAETALREAESANRAKSDFLSRMSHELRTPLNAILGFGQILERQHLTALQEESVQYILSGGRHLLDLINEVLDIARVEAGHVELSLEPILLCDLVAQSWDMVRPLAAEQNIHYTENISTQSHLHVFADRQRFKQVLINLLSNAIKYNRVGGDVTVLCCEQPDGRVCLAVQDTGPGISTEHLSRLFTPFERLSAANSDIEGTGLGLVLSRGLMTAMGGTLEVKSTVGEGSTFSVTLPWASAPQARERLPGGSPDITLSPEESLYTVLCIEDKLSNLHLLEAIFEMRPGVKLLAAMQGSIGLDLARQHAPDLILLDLNLPDISGQEVLSQLRQSNLTRNIPVIVISADAIESQVQRLLNAGAQAYLTKPIDVARFLQTADSILQNRERNKVNK
jgi:PAS domain S-box-containing protein